MDLFASTQKFARVIEKECGETSLSIAIQDGPETGQAVEHVHVHLLPRNKRDFESYDDVYKVLDEHLLFVMMTNNKLSPMRWKKMRNDYVVK